MAECGICLDVLQNPVSIPCGHVHCERCLRNHINVGADALKSACPTCRKPFHIASPDLAFVPQKYHDFILPSVRKIYMDVPSAAAMGAEIDCLKQRLDVLARKNESLRQYCTDYKRKLGELAIEKHAIIEREVEARKEVVDLRRKYEFLKKRCWEAQSCDYARNTPSRSLSRRSSQDMDAAREVHPKVEEHPVSLRDLSPQQSRPKRALPKSRLSNSMHHKNEQIPQLAKRQRTHRYSYVGSSSQPPQVVCKNEDEDENEGEEDE